VASRAKATALIAVLPAGERALWACALYAGLRGGQLRALGWSDVDLASVPAAIHGRRTWDDNESRSRPTPVSRAVRRLGRLCEAIVEHGLATCRGGDDLMFGRTPALPFIPSDRPGSGAEACDGRWARIADAVRGAALRGELPHRGCPERHRTHRDDRAQRLADDVT
jgi:integrase